MGQVAAHFLFVFSFGMLTVTAFLLEVFPRTSSTDVLCCGLFPRAGQKGWFCRTGMEGEVQVISCFQGVSGLCPAGKEELVQISTGW